MPLVINGLVNIDNSNVFHAVVSSVTHTNKYNGIFMDGVQHVVSGSVTWSNTEVPYVMNDGTVLGIDPGASLTLGNNVVLKFDGGRIDLSGSLTEGTGDYFTSLKDDLKLGDTNGDAAATSPVNGDWLGIQICPGGPCSWATWGNILFATIHP
jgi:hypothetical protein